MWFRSPAARALYVLGGVIFGVAIAATSSLCCSSERWLAWAPTALAFTVASGAVFGYGLARWPEIAALGQVRRRRAVVLAAVILTVTVTVVIVGFWVTQPIASNLRGRLIVSFAVLSAIPALVSLDAIRGLARTVGGAPGEQVEKLVALRRLLSGLLAAGGALLALFILATGAGLQAGPDPLRRHDGAIELRDSKEAGQGPILRFTPAELDAFLDGAKTGEFDHLLD